MMVAADISQFNPARILQAFFISAAATIAFLNAIPLIRRHLIQYGARTGPPESSPPPASQTTNVEQIVQKIAALRVPHRYFIHFYIVSVISSILWGIQLSMKGNLVNDISSRSPKPPDASSMSIDQMTLLWGLVAVQGGRRLFESMVLVKKDSRSPMWVGHWILGMAFYLALGVAAWIEGAGQLASSDISFPSRTISAPSIWTMLFIPVFLLSSGIQYDIHAHLASLKTYTVPAHPAFQLALCPHYMAECWIYLSLAILSAPKGQFVNTTMFCAFILVSTNLAVTASNTRDWYERKFGKEAIRNHWTLVPFVW